MGSRGLYGLVIWQAQNLWARIWQETLVCFFSQRLIWDKTREAVSIDYKCDDGKKVGVLRGDIGAIR
jgi:hypothetical protein